MKKYIDNFIDPNRGPGEYSAWPIYEHGFQSISAETHRGSFTTGVVLEDGKSFAKYFSVDGPFMYNGWKNNQDRRALTLLEDHYDTLVKLHEIQKNDGRIHVPTPKGLNLIRELGKGSLHPATIMDYIPDHFDGQDPEKKMEIAIEKEEMIKILENEYGQIVGPHARDKSNFVYNQDINGGTIFLVGFSLWNKNL